MGAKRCPRFPRSKMCPRGGGVGFFCQDVATFSGALKVASAASLHMMISPSEIDGCGGATQGRGIRVHVPWVRVVTGAPLVAKEHLPLGTALVKVSGVRSMVTLLKCLHIVYNIYGKSCEPVYISAAATYRCYPHHCIESLSSPGSGKPFASDVIARFVSLPKKPLSLREFATVPATVYYID